MRLPTKTFPGTVTRTTPRFSSDYPPTLRALEIGVKDLLVAFYMLSGKRDVVLFAITIDPRQPIRMNLSAEVEKGAEKIEEQIVAELHASRPEVS